MHPEAEDAPYSRTHRNPNPQPYRQWKSGHERRWHPHTDGDACSHQDPRADFRANLSAGDPLRRNWNRSLGWQRSRLHGLDRLRQCRAHDGAR